MAIARFTPCLFFRPCRLLSTSSTIVISITVQDASMKYNRTTNTMLIYIDFQVRKESKPSPHQFDSGTEVNRPRNTSRVKLSSTSRSRRRNLSIALGFGGEVSLIMSTTRESTYRDPFGP